MLKALFKKLFGKASADLPIYTPTVSGRVELDIHTSGIEMPPTVDFHHHYPLEIEEEEDREDESARRHYVQCASTAGLHNMAFHEWGDPDNPNVLICVHGLTRRGSDFTVLAKAMRDKYRVICPDVVGRGDSDWLTNPMLYGIPQYVSDMVTLIARLGVTRVDWFGTSMGGLIGLFLASQAHSPIRKMILNDVGPRIEPTALKRLGDYVGKPMRFPTKREGIQYLNAICAPFGKLTAEQWRTYNGPHLMKDGDAWVLHYDPDISKPFSSVTMAAAAMGEMMTWKAYDAIEADMLIVRGAESDLLSKRTVTEMCKRNPRARSIEIPGAGHAPAFVVPEQVALAREFFS